VGQTGLLVDPYNGFLSEGGKRWPMVKEVAGDVGLLDNLRAVRQAGIQVFVVPHRRWEPGDYEGWEHPNPTQLAVQKRHTFARGTWGGEWHPDFVPQAGDVVVKEHWAQSGFANTDPDFQLKQRGVSHVIGVGFACQYLHRVNQSVRDGTWVSCDPAARRDRRIQPREMHAAHHLNGPTFAHSVLTTHELLAPGCLVRCRPN
jgi:nicotinamidase-related amidase